MDEFKKALYSLEQQLLYLRKDLNANLEDFYEMIEVLFRLHETLGKSAIVIKPWEKYMETLINKLGIQALSLHHLVQGYSYAPKRTDAGRFSNKTILDITSCSAILRAQFENFLMFSHIYINPDTDDEKELRHCAWIYSALLLRQKHPTNEAESLLQKEKDKIAIARLAEQIKKLPSYERLSIKQQKSLLESGSGKLFSHWEKIMEESGFTNSTFKLLYNMLSIQAHSEGLSSLQLSQASSFKDSIANQDMANMYLLHSKILICLMIEAINKRFDIAAKEFEKLDEQTRHKVAEWVDYLGR
jgi:hypothetical protein